jgi:hypothetical protein
VNVAPIVEMFKASPDVTGAASSPEGSELSPQTFKASLLALSRAPSETGVACEHRTGIKPFQKANSEGVELPSSLSRTPPVVSSAPTQQVGRRQAQAVQQPSLINPTLTAVQLTPVRPHVSSHPLTLTVGYGNPHVSVAGVTPIEGNIPRPSVANCNSVPSDHVQKENITTQVASTSPLSAKVSRTSTKLSNVVANVTPKPLFTEFRNQPFNAVANVAESLVPYAAPGILSDIPRALRDLVSSTILKSVSVAIPTTVPTAIRRAFPDALENSAPAPNASLNPFPQVAPALVLPSVANASVTGPIGSKSRPASTGEVDLPVTASDLSKVAPSLIAPKPGWASTSEANPSVAASDPSRVATSLIALNLSPASTGEVDLPVTASDLSKVAPSLIALKLSPASTGEVDSPVTASDLSKVAPSFIAPKSSPASTSEADPPVTASDPGRVATSFASNGPAFPPAPVSDPSGLAMGLLTPAATFDQLGAMIQPNGELPLAAEAVASSLTPVAVANASGTAVSNQKDGANAINDVAGLKQHIPIASDQTGSQTSSQETALCRDQSQGGSSPQGQGGAAPVQMSVVNHTTAVVDHAQNAGVTAPLQTAPMLTGASGHAPRTTDTSSPATISLPQAVTVINTAKLIQTTGQSEMRVDMRSNDFGNISISTSATRDLISAQISLDHGELARTLAAHLPEMQARLSSQPMDVRIDMNGQATGQRTGTTTDMSNGSADGSRGDRPQGESPASSQSVNGFAGYGNSIVAAVSTSGEGRQDERLDIRV